MKRPVRGKNNLWRELEGKPEVKWGNFARQVDFEENVKSNIKPIKPYIGKYWKSHSLVCQCHFYTINNDNNSYNLMNVVVHMGDVHHPIPETTVKMVTT